METTNTTRLIVNKPRRVMRHALLTALVMIGGAVAVGYSDIDGMNGGYAIIFGLGFFAMVAVVVALVYIPRARDFNTLINDMKPLAHWTYNQNEWEAFIREDLKEKIVLNKGMLKYISVISLVVLALLLFISRDVFFIWIIGGLIALLTLVAFIAPLFRTATLKKGNHIAIIGERAAYVGGLFQTWTRLGARLSGVDLNTEGEIPILHIIFEVPTLQAYQQEIVRIPVPAGKMPQAEQIMELLKKSILFNN